MPRLSDTMEEGAISTWRKHPGDTVAVGDVLVEIETDKAVMEYEAYQAGVLSKILVDEGQVAEIGSAIALIDDGTGGGRRASRRPPPRRASHRPAAAAASGRRDAAAGATAVAERRRVVAAGNGAAPSDTRLIASPLVRKLATGEQPRPVAACTGTGPGGRIIRADISDLLGGAAPAPGPAPAAAPAVRGPTVGGGFRAACPGAAHAGAPPRCAVQAAGDDCAGPAAVPVSQVRRVIARRLSPAPARSRTST